jgi:hypothetical protein
LIEVVRARQVQIWGDFYLGAFLDRRYAEDNNRDDAAQVSTLSNALGDGNELGGIHAKAHQN